VVSDVHAALSPADQRWVQFLGALLPAGFRDRQRGEWAADLLMLAHDPAARRRYLLAAARTLPALRAVARGHESAALVTPGRPSAVTTGRVIATMLAWTVSGWLSTVLVPYLFLRTRDDASGFDMWGWLTGPAQILTPIMAVLFWGGLSTLLGPVLTGITSAVTLLLAVAERRRSAGHRLGTAAASVALFLIASGQYGLYNSRYHTDGDSLAVLAMAALPLMTRRAGLSMRRRVVLGVLAAAAAAIVILYHTPFGYDMAVWLQD
jgi:hypothetical protein